jgi:hypothetical protein
MPKETPNVSMSGWFATATPEECDAMSALQLDYRFSGDHLGSVWWIHLQELDFKHNCQTLRHIRDRRSMQETNFTK